MIQGRGRGRGRRRGRRPPAPRRARNQGNTNRPPQSQDGQDVDLLDTVLITDNDAIFDINGDSSRFFVRVASMEKHLEAQNTNSKRYAATIAALLDHGVEIAANARIRALAGAWARGDHSLAESLLSIRDNFGLVEVLKAASLLDSGRQLRQWERRNRAIELHGGKPRPSTLAKIKTAKDNLAALTPSQGSLSGALCRHIRAWVHRFTVTELEFFALHMPPDGWKKLADLVHLNPTRDFPGLPWFLPFCYGVPAPEDSRVARSRSLTAENVNSVLEEIALPFAHVRSHLAVLTPASKAKIVRGEDKVDRGIWWYEELACPEVQEAIQERLDAGEQVTLNYGKLMERLLTFRLMGQNCPAFTPSLMPLAQRKLDTTHLTLESPVAVLADASSSMDVAIRTATIISSILTASTSARLVFFNHSAWEAESNPTNAEDVLALAMNTRANGSTSPAAGLMHFYGTREVVKSIIVVTDEEENTPSGRFSFLDLYRRYREEVFDARLIFVSFLSRQTDVGQMVAQIKEADIPVLQFRLSRARPDLTKLDNILGQLSMDGAILEGKIKEFQDRIEGVEGLEGVFQTLQISHDPLLAPN